jgi:hypothetical protein
LGHGEKHCQSIGPCHWPNNCSDGEPVAVQELCCVVCPEEIRRNGWTPCNCPGTCAEGQKPILVSYKTMLPCTKANVMISFRYLESVVLYVKTVTLARLGNKLFKSITYMYCGI